MRRSGWVGVTLLVISAAVGCDDEGMAEPRHVDGSRAEVRAAVSSNIKVAFALHRVLREQPGNLFYSPLSIEAVLGMLYAGAGGDSAAQLGSALGADGDADSFHTGLGLLLDDLAGDYPGRGYTLTLTNRLFAGLDVRPSAAFTRTTSELYRAPLERVDFGEPETARSQINRWVNEQTKGIFPELLKPAQITSLSRLAIVNTLYFKADWAHAFDVDSTHSAPFERADGTKLNVPMMRLKKTALRTATVAGGQLVELPYRDGNLSFLAWLPPSANGLPALEESLDDLPPSALTEALLEREVVVELPRFMLQARVDLVPVLKALGVRDIFEFERADLSGIDPTLPLAIDPFVHEAYIKVDERGTTAAAATAAVALTRSANIPITFNRPFLFFIRDELTGAILFIGRLSEPPP